MMNVYLPLGDVYESPWLMIVPDGIWVPQFDGPLANVVTPVELAVSAAAGNPAAGKGHSKLLVPQSTLPYELVTCGEVGGETLHSVEVDEMSSTSSPHMLLFCWHGL